MPGLLLAEKWQTKYLLKRNKGCKKKMEAKKEMTTLREIPCGTTVRVMQLSGEGAVKRRIMDMGITKGKIGRAHV